MVEPIDPSMIRPVGPTEPGKGPGDVAPLRNADGKTFGAARTARTSGPAGIWIARTAVGVDGTPTGGCGKTTS